MEKANNLIKDYSEMDEFLYYVDTATPMLGNESLPDSSLFVDDGLHLNTNGYVLFARQKDRRIFALIKKDQKIKAL